MVMLDVMVISKIGLMSLTDSVKKRIGAIPGWQGYRNRTGGCEDASVPSVEDNSMKSPIGSV